MTTEAIQRQITMQAVESKQLASIGHHAESNTLAIQFKGWDGKPGSVYHYANFTADDFKAFQDAESMRAIASALAAAPKPPEASPAVAQSDELAKLKDPHAVHVNMLRGTIAKIGMRELAHVHGEEMSARWQRFEEWEASQAAVAQPENKHDWPGDWPHENGKYLSRCHQCHVFFTGHKRRVTCKVCASPAVAQPDNTAAWESGELGRSAEHAKPAPSDIERQIAEAVAQPVADERAEYERMLRAGYQHDNVRRQERGLASSDELTQEQEREIAERVALKFPSDAPAPREPIAFSCAKRAAYPTSWTMTCDKHCGDGAKCLRAAPVETSAHAALCQPAEEGGKA